MRSLFAVVLFFTGAAAAQPSNQDLFNEIDSTLDELSGITRLPVRSRVGRDFITKPKLKAFLESRITESVKPEEIRVEELTLKLFGFIPEDYDLKTATINLLTEQAAAFYDYRKRKIFVLETAPEVSQRFVLIHELAHALADQHFRLEKFIRSGRNDDSATARLAVMEGQAQWLMYEVIARKGGQSLRKDPGMARMMVNLSGGGLSEFPELSNAPLYIRESLLFPYTRGLLFQQEVIDKFGERGFAQVFRKPPRTSQQIIHPGHYFNGRRPPAVKLPKPEGAQGFEPLIEGDLGEFDIHVLLRQFVDQGTADRLAPHWSAGLYRVLEHRQTKKPLLLFRVVFDDPASAAEFAQLYREKVLPAKKRQEGKPRVEVRDGGVDVIEGLE